LVLTNRPGQPGETPGTVTIVLVDELIDQNAHASYYRATLQSIRSQVQKVLAALQPGQQVALYELRAEGVVVAQELTDDSAALTAAVKTIGARQLKARFSPVGARPETALTFSRSAGPANFRKTSITEDLRIALVKQAFQGIAHHFQGSPARKNIVWISAVFPTIVTGFNPALMAAERDAINPIPGHMLPVPEFADPQGHYEQLRALARQMSNGNISVYPADSKGLVLGSVRDLQGERSFVDLLASETGGRAFYDANGVDVPLREVVEEGRVTYLLGYYPGDGAWDGKYHHVEVRLRRPGLSVLCRKGYFAADEPLPKDSDTALRTAAKGMLEWSGIGVTLNVSSNPLEWFDQVMVVKLDTQEIHFENKDGRWRAQLDVVFAQIAKDGRILESVKDHLELALLPQTYSDAATQGWLYPKTVDVNPKAEKLRVVVRDLATGAVGSVSIPIYHPKGA
jgi:VWFA-related protein